MSPLHKGPFKIEEVMGQVTYKLKLPPQWKIHNVFHRKFLTLYRETDVDGKNFPEPPPDLIEGEDEYEVDSIRDHRKRSKAQQYLVKWKGYSDETWEPEANLKNASEILKILRQSSKLATKPTSFFATLLSSLNMYASIFNTESFTAATLFVERLFQNEDHILQPYRSMPEQPHPFPRSPPYSRSHHYRETP
jgi:hypothetical protein